jgi:DNA-binding XRE family transcriptional regulator
MSQNPSDIIAAKRRALGLSQQAAATAAGISISGWQIIERGVLQNPSLDTARRIAKVLNCSLADIWDWARVSPVKTGRAK